MATSPTYTGSCHCGKVKFEAMMALEQAIECNCSICSRLGALRAACAEEQFKLLSGEDDLTDYQFGRKHIHHTFCRHCGVHAFAYGAGHGGKKMRMINVRCLEGVDLSKLKVMSYDGKSR